MAARDVDHERHQKLITLAIPSCETAITRLPPQGRRLLAYLNVQSGRFVTRDALCSLLWDSEKPNAKHSLSQIIYVIKTRCAFIGLETTGDAVRLPIRLPSDLDDLELAMSTGAVEEVASHYRGVFLPALESNSSKAFELWRDSRNAMIHQRVGTFYRVTLENCARAGEWERCLQVGQHLEDLGIADPGTDEIVSKARAASQYPNPFENTTAPFARFVGRSKEMRMLRNAQLQSSCPFPIVLLNGESGIGKTRLATQFGRAMALDGYKVHLAQCYEAEKHVAFSPIAQLLGGLDRGRQDGLPIQVREALAILHPAYLDPHRPDQERPNPSKTFLFEAISAAVQLDAAGRKLLLIIDDIQWCDEASSEWLHHFQRSHNNDEGGRADMSGAEGALLVLHRNDIVETNRHVRWTITHPDTTCIDLEPLTLPDAQLLLNECLIANGVRLASDELSNINKTCLGHPLFIIAVADSIGKGDAEGIPDRLHLPQVPHAIQRLVSYRLERLSANAKLVADTLSCISAPPSLESLSNYTQLPHSDVIKAAIELATGRLIAENELRFTHGLIKRSVYSSLSSISKRLLHEQIYHNTQGESAALRSFQARKAGLRFETYSHSMQAAKEANTVYAYNESLHHLETAIETAGSAAQENEASLAAIQLLYDLQRHADAAALAQRLATRYQTLDDAGRVVCAIATINWKFISGAERAADLNDEIRKLIDQASSCGSSPHLMRTLRLAVYIAHHIGDSSELEEIFAQVEFVSSQLDKSSRAELLATSGAILAISNRERAIKMSDHAIKLADEIGEPRVRIVALSTRGGIHTQYGEIQAALDFLALAEEICNSAGLRDMLSIVHANRACILFDQGKFEEGRAENRKAMTSLSYRPLLPILNEAAAYLDVGDSNSAISFANQSLKLNSQLSVPWVEMVATTIKGLAFFQQKDYENALQAGERVSLLFPTTRSMAATTDLSYTDIFLSRLDMLRGNRNAAVDRLNASLRSQNMNAFARCRVEIALAESLAPNEKDAAFRWAKGAYSRAKKLESSNLMSKASAILDRLQ